MKTYPVFLVVIFLALFSCSQSSVSIKNDKTEQGKYNKNKAKKDKYGKVFFTEKTVSSYVKFRWIRANKTPLYKANSKFSSAKAYLDAKDYVQIVNGRLGLTMTLVRVFDKTKGYEEGYVKSASLSNLNYYSEPYEMSENEIERRATIAKLKKQQKEDVLKRTNEIRKEQKFRNILTLSREDSKVIIGMNYNSLSNYMKKEYKEDALYADNATNTVKFDKKDKSGTIAYFSLKNSRITGVLIINNSTGLSEREANVALYEFGGEIYYTVDEIENISENITKKIGILEKSKYPIVIKTDITKKSPITEVIIGEFSGIE